MAGPSPEHGENAVIVGVNGLAERGADHRAGHSPQVGIEPGAVRPEIERAAGRRGRCDYVIRRRDDAADVRIFAVTLLCNRPSVQTRGIPAVSEVFRTVQRIWTGRI